MSLEIDLSKDWQRLEVGCKNAAQVFEQALEKTTRGALILLVGEMKRYPPVKETYTRTLTLRRTWTAALPTWKTITNGYMGKVGNNTPYAPRVQSKELQAWMHKGWWKTDEEIMAENEGRIERYFDTSISRAVGRIERGE
jgi:hypothetical protein